MRVAIVGGPGVGKSTLVRQLADLYHNAAYGEGEEGVWDPRVLEDIDAGRNPVGVTAYFARLYDANYRDAADNDRPGKVIFFEGARITLEAHIAEYPAEYHDALRKVLAIGDAWNPDRVIVLTSNTETIEKHIRQRNRPYESAENMVRRFRLIDGEFRRLAPGYLNTVVINRDHMEFHERAGLVAIVKAAGSRCSARFPTRSSSATRPARLIRRCLFSWLSRCVPGQGVKRNDELTSMRSERCRLGCSGGCMRKTRTIWTGVSTAIVGFATVVGAQTTSAPQSTAPASEAQITVTGCLKQGVMTVGTAGTAGVAGTAGTTGTAGTAGTATTADNPAALMFTLTNATSAPGDASSTTAAASTTGTASTTVAPAATSGSSGQTYRLIANPTALSPLVGKKLALTGVLDPQDNAALANDPAAGPDANAPVLRVKAGKIVAASCQ